MWIKNYLDRHEGQAPSYQEISDGVGCNKTGAARIVHILIKRGHMTHKAGYPRTLALLEKKQ